MACQAAVEESRKGHDWYALQALVQAHVGGNECRLRKEELGHETVVHGNHAALIGTCGKDARSVRTYGWRTWLAYVYRSRSVSAGVWEPAYRSDECTEIPSRDDRGVVVEAESGTQEGCRKMSRTQKLRSRLGVHVNAKRK